MFWDFVGDVAKLEYPIFFFFWLVTFVPLWNRSNLPGWYRLSKLARVGSRFRVAGLPPAWLFAIVWMVLYSLIFITLFLWWRDFDASTADWYGWVLLLFFINIVLTKLWMPVFFGSSNNANAMYWMFPLSLLINLALLSSAVLIVIFFALDGAWLEFGLLIVYPIWLVYAFILNAQFVSIGSLGFFSAEAVREYESIQQSLEQSRNQARLQMSGQYQQPSFQQTPQYFREEYFRDSKVRQHTQ